MKNTKIIIMIGFLLTSLSLLNACGTARGFGQDVSKAGHEIQKAAR